MHSIDRFRSGSRIAAGLMALTLAVGVGCGGSGSGLTLFVDAEYDPAAASNTNPGIHEASLSVAQTFTVLQDGKFEEFEIVLTQGSSVDDGVVRIDVRPVLPTGEPEPDDTNSLFTPIDIDTVDLPATLMDEYTLFDVGDEPNREVLAGEEYAIVVTFVSRTGVDTNQPIAYLLGRLGDEYADGSGSLDPDGLGFTNDMADYFFRTFVLAES